MNIVFAGAELEELRTKYTVLELDTFKFLPSGHLATSYALIDSVPINEIHRISEFSDLHHNLMQNFKKRNWKYCEDAIEHLISAWNGELQSFYENLLERINTLKTNVPDDGWDGSLVKY